MDESLEVVKKRKNPYFNDTKHVDDVGEDRLSSLPECLLVDILSLLPIHTAITTSVLSHCWRHLWTQVTSVHFSSYPGWELDAWMDQDSLTKFYINLDRTFKQLVSPKLRTFSLWVPLDPYRESRWRLYQSYRESWFSHLYDHRSPEEVEIYHNMEDLVTLPHCFFRSPSLVSLKIEGNFDFPDDDNNDDDDDNNDDDDDDDDDDDCPSFLPSLKKLSLSMSYPWNYSARLSKLIFKSCPALQRLHIDIAEPEYEDDAEEVYFEISCPNLKYLILIVSRNSHNSRFLINLPRLEHIKLNVFSSSFIQFVECPSGLLEAEIIIHDYKESTHLDSTFNIVKGISYAKSLNLILVCPCLMDLYRSDKARIPLFTNLTWLKTHGRSNTDLVICLLHCPNLEVIEMQCTNCCIRLDADLCTSSCVPQCLSSKLKRIKLWDLKGTDDELELLEYVLMNGKVLELLDVDMYISESREAQIFRSIQYTEKLFSFQRSSKNCEIIFCSPYFSASSKGLE